MKRLRELGVGRRGFTLVELMIVIAVLAVLAAIVIPSVVGILSRGKERAYNADLKAISAAVDSYQSDPDNTKFQGVRQYPIYGRGAATTNISPCVDDQDATAGLNPDRGTKGGNPLWIDDDADGVRDSGEKWQATSQTKGTTVYCYSTGNFIIDLTELQTKKFLQAAPKSASVDNITAGTGSYTWYVDANGKVESLYYYLPASASTGFKAGVYP